MAGMAGKAGEASGRAGRAGGPAPPVAREVVRVRALLGPGAGAGPAPGRIACAALGGGGGGGGGGEVLWLGLEGGAVWEARLAGPAASPGVAPAGLLLLRGAVDLGAGPVGALCALPGARGGVAALAGGQLFRVDRGGAPALPLRPGPAHLQRGASALALRRADASGGSSAPGPPLLAAAFRGAPSLGRAKRTWLALLRLPEAAADGVELLQEAELEGVPEAVTSLAWQGQNIVFATATGFHVYSVDADLASPIFELPAGAPSPARLWALPRSGEVALFMDNVGTVVDGAGQPTGRTLLPQAAPDLLLGVSAFVLVAQGGNLVVFERGGDLHGGCVQGVPLHNFAEPGAAAAGAGGVGGVELVAGLEDAGGCFAVICTPSAVALVAPVPFKDQCLELLRGRRYAEALNLADLGDAGGRAAWHQELRAEVGFLQLADLRFADALANLLSCPAVQPCELFPLFPEYTSKWLPLVPKTENWGLRPPLVDLSSLVRGAGAGAGAGAGGDAAEVAREREAKQFVANYLHSSRQLRRGARSTPGEGLALPDGVDWLLLRLLDDLGDSGLIERLCTGPNDLEGGDVVAALERAGRLHALALLHRAKGRPLEALGLWRDLGEGRRRDSGSGSLASGAEPGEGRAVDCALDTLRGLSRAEGRIGGDAALRFFPWLLQEAPKAALGLLLDGNYGESEVAALLRDHAGADIQWRYLHHAVVRAGSQDGRLHTELGLKMVEAVREGACLPEELGEVRSQLQDFLRASDLYDTELLLDALAGADLAAEKVAVFTKRGEHSKALRILAVDMGDIEAAEQHCSQHGGQESYMLLLEMLLSPQGGEPPRFDHAIRILSAREACLDPCQLLDTLPDNMPLPLAAGTIERILKERLHRKRLGQIERGLARARESAATAEAVQVQRSSVTVTQDTLCGVCGTRLGTKVFARYPNNVLACYRCYRKGSPEVCPVTGNTFQA